MNRTAAYWQWTLGWGVVVLFSGCTSVAPWERGNLAKPQMALDPHPAQSILREHIYNSREAVTRGHSGNGGSGCGCY